MKAHFLVLIAALGARPAAGASCAGGFSVKKLLSSASDDDLGRLESRDLQRYFVFQGLAARSDSPCRALAALGSRRSSEPWQTICLRAYYELAFSRAVAEKDPAVARYCEKAVGSDRDFASVARDKIGPLCRRLDFADIPGACAEIAGLFEEGPKRQERLRLCRRYLGSLRDGDENACSETKDQEDILRCRQYAAFHRAKAAKDIKACGDGELCRAFMGEGRKVAEAYAEKLKGEYCR